MSQVYKLDHMISRVIEMHQKFGIHPEHEGALTAEEMKFRIGALYEEFQEGRDAVSDEEEFDAIIDLVVFAIGTVDRMGMSVHLMPTYNTLSIQSSEPNWDNMEKLLISFEKEAQSLVSLNKLLTALAYIIDHAFELSTALGYENIFMAGFNRVQDANIAKELGANKNKAGGRGEFKIDLRKPEGWTAPDHSDLILSL